MATTRWGIVGTGGIARQFARGLHVLPDAELVAVGSRTQAAADRFGDEFGIAQRHGSYDALAADPDIDVVYVATPHNLHHTNTIQCLEAGKAVLCEKPFAINAREATEMITVARRERRFLMEAMWTRFLPAITHARQLLADGVLGEPRMLQADFGFRTPFTPGSRLFDPKLGGGALLDVGVYPVSLASLLFGKPSRMTGFAQLGATGVDEQGAMVLGYDNGQLAVLSTAIRTQTPQGAWLMGTEGRLHIHAPWWMPTDLTLFVGNHATPLHLPFDGNGYNYEADKVGRLLHEGKLESDTMPLDETLQIMETLDELRRQWGVRYPME